MSNINTNKDEAMKEEAATGCMLILLLVFLSPFSVWFNAWVTLQMYNWFILPFVAGAPAMSIVPLIGLSCIVGMFTVHLTKIENVKPDGTKVSIRETFGKALTRMFLYPVFALGFAWMYQFIFIR